MEEGDELGALDGASEGIVLSDGVNDGMLDGISEVLGIADELG